MLARLRATRQLNAQMSRNKLRGIVSCLLATRRESMKKQSSCRNAFVITHHAWPLVIGFFLYLPRYHE